jgi:hypothetical protein
MKKLAFLFLTNNNLKQPGIWNTFFSSHRGLFSIYNHPKESNLVTDDLLKNNIISNLIETKWGNISLVNATINMLEEAYNDSENYKFILVSESCIPVQTFEETYKFLTRNDDTYIASYFGNNNRYDKLIDKSFVSKENFKKQHQWMVLNRNTVKLIIDTRFHTDNFKNTFAPDEHYFINVIIKYNYPFVNRKLTYVYWKDCTKHPKTFAKIDEYVLAKLRIKGYFFLRKVDENTIIQKIEK